MDSVKVRIPVLARLMLAELAERRGQEETALLTDLIKREAVTEFCVAPCGTQMTTDGR